MENTRHINGWLAPGYQQSKKENFTKLDNYLGFAPTTLLDIGCGMAWESRFFYNQYKTEIWLIDGDNKSNNSNAIDRNFHSDPKKFGFYHELDYLREQINSTGFTNYTLINSNEISIPKDKKFDVITSWLSCGFHYPVSTYKDLILDHSHKNTRIIMDIRVGLKNRWPEIDNDVEIVSIISYHKKHINAEIRFKE